MKIEYSKTALKSLKKIPKAKQIRTVQVIKKLKNNPNAGKKLKGELAGLLSVKVWSYIIIYSKVSKNKIFINAIEHRQGVYK